MYAVLFEGFEARGQQLIKSACLRWVLLKYPSPTHAHISISTSLTQTLRNKNILLYLASVSPSLSFALLSCMHKATCSNSISLTSSISNTQLLICLEVHGCLFCTTAKHPQKGQISCILTSTAVKHDRSDIVACLPFPMDCIRIN